MKLTYLTENLAPEPVIDPAPGPLISVNFNPSDENMINPERGFYQWINLLDGNSYQDVRALSNSSLVYAGVRLDGFRNSPLSSSMISQIKAGLGRLRGAGLKAILRFQYNDGPYPIPDPDASKATILNHLIQLKPVFQENADVIAVLQAGFIGAWGEWHTSTNGLETKLAQKEILLGILQALPPTLMTQIRVPEFKGNIFESDLPIQESQAFNQSVQSRVGHHNDCFLASADDFGTYPSDATEKWKDYVAADGRFTPIGGETCVKSERTGCAIAMAEMQRLHFSYLNAGFNASVIDGWKSNGCFNRISKSLGYRISLSKVSHSSGIRPGGLFKISVSLVNEGYAAMFNHRDVIAVFDQVGTANRFNIAMPGVDPRRWESLKPLILEQQILIPPGMPPGIYRLSLWLPDDNASVRNNSNFSVKLAYQSGFATWDSGLGLNVLNPAVVINP